MSVRLVAALVLAAGGLGCAANYRITNQENFITYDRPFTAATAEEVRKDADSICSHRRQVAVQISDVCNLTRCFTNYQCVTKAELPTFVP